MNEIPMNVGRYMIKRRKGTCASDNLPYGNTIFLIVKKKGIWRNKYQADWMEISR